MFFCLGLVGLEVETQIIYSESRISTENTEGAEKNWRIMFFCLGLVGLEVSSPRNPRSPC